VQKAAAAAAAAGSGEDKTPTQTSNQKMSDFRSKFEKFGGSSSPAVKPGSTPAPFRRNSAAADVTAASTGDKSSTSNKDLLSDLQKQLMDAEKTRVKDRQELLDKLTVQKKEFDGELTEMKKKNKQVCSSHQISLFCSTLSASELRLIPGYNCAR